jgi:hypothetical protein
MIVIVIRKEKKSFQRFLRIRTAEKRQCHVAREIEQVVGGSADGVEGHEFTFVDVVADEATVATAATPSNATSGRVKK